MIDDARVAARQALARGDVLIAYDQATHALDADPDDLEASYLCALALARSGAQERAVDAAHEVRARVDASATAPIQLREDADALVARLAKDEALAATDPETRADRARVAAELYEAAADRYGRHYSCVNAATLWLLAGDAGRARSLAAKARALAAEVGDDEYWRRATEAEAALVLGEEAEARAALVSAAAVTPADQGARATTRRQLRVVCAELGLADDVLSVIAPPSVVHYCGRMAPADWDRVRDEVATYAAEHNVGYAYGSLACGADIVVAEALLDRGVELNVLLPFTTDEFETVSVAAAGAGWHTRFRAALDAAASVTLTTDSAYCGDDALFGYASNIAMGRAINRAAFLDAAVGQLAVWDGVPARNPVGTARDIATWEATGRHSHVIRVESAPKWESAPVASAESATREVRAILFADFRGFSRLHDEDFPGFVRQGLGALGAALHRHHAGLLWSNTWGDAIQAIFTDPASAARAALDLHAAVVELHERGSSLPPDLTLRVGAHAGPVLRLTDPVGGGLSYWGRELTRAARIEPRTPEGEVYVTEAFAALLALEPATGISCEYVGRITTAKDFETIPMYRLRPDRG